MTVVGVYRLDPGLQWRYHQPRRLEALLSPEPTDVTDVAQWIVRRGAAHFWLHEPDPAVDWHYYGRDFYVPLGAPQQTKIDAESGMATFVGQAPTVNTAQVEGVVEIPIYMPMLVPTGGVYHTHVQAWRRITSISESGAAAAVSGVTINAPAGEIVFAGQPPDLGDTIVTAPLGEFSFTGLAPSVVAEATEGPTALFYPESTVAAFGAENVTQVFLPGDDQAKEAA